MAPLPVNDPQTIETRLSDGTVLVADVYRPAGAGRHPVLLMRQPYGRRIASTVVLAHPAWYASRGYVVMVQDVRGRGDSGGRFRVLADDMADGAETLEAAAALPGGDGRVATYGFSYQGMTQYMALAGARRAGTRAPDAMAVIMAAWNVRDHWAMEGGAFRMQANQFWALQMAVENARIAGDADACHALRSAIGAMCAGPVPARMAALEAWPQFTHYHDWLADDPAYWDTVSPHKVLGAAALDVPSLHIGGWLDVMLESTFAAHSAFAAAGAAQWLRVGPWCHLPWGRRVGELDCGPEAAAGVDCAVVRFLDHVLKDAPPPGAPVTLFDLGTRSYRDFDAMPETRERDFHLASTGRAAPSTTDGRLDSSPARRGPIASCTTPGARSPPWGLHLGTPAGYVDRAAIDDRADVAVFGTAPLEAAVTLLGRVTAVLWVECDAAAFDLSATLSVVSPDGRALAVTGGHRRVMRPDGRVPVTIDMRRTGFTVPKGCSLRLSLQGAAWPAFMVNPGTGERPEDVGLDRCRVVTLTIRHGADAPSRLTVSVLD